MENFHYIKWKLCLWVSSGLHAVKMAQTCSLGGQSTAPPLRSSLFSFKKMLIDYRSWKSCPKCIFTMGSKPFRNCIRSFCFYPALTMGTYNVVVRMIGQLDFGRIEDFPWLKLLRSINVIFLRITLRLCGRIFWIRLMKVNFEKVWPSISNWRYND